MGSLQCGRLLRGQCRAAQRHFAERGEAPVCVLCVCERLVTSKRVCTLACEWACLCMWRRLCAVCVSVFVRVLPTSFTLRSKGKRLCVCCGRVGVWRKSACLYACEWACLCAFGFTMPGACVLCAWACLCMCYHIKLHVADGRESSVCVCVCVSCGRVGVWRKSGCVYTRVSGRALCAFSFTMRTRLCVAACVRVRT